MIETKTDILVVITPSVSRDPTQKHFSLLSFRLKNNCAA